MALKTKKALSKIYYYIILIKKSNYLKTGLFKFIIGSTLWRLACINHAASKESSYVCK